MTDIETKVDLFLKETIKQSRIDSLKKECEFSSLYGACFVKPYHRLVTYHHLEAAAYIILRSKIIEAVENNIDNTQCCITNCISETILDYIVKDSAIKKYLYHKNDCMYEMVRSNWILTAAAFWSEIREQKKIYNIEKSEWALGKATDYWAARNYLVNHVLQVYIDANKPQPLKYFFSKIQQLFTREEKNFVYFSDGYTYEELVKLLDLHELKCSTKQQTSDSDRIINEIAKKSESVKDAIKKSVDNINSHTSKEKEDLHKEISELSAAISDELSPELTDINLIHDTILAKVLSDFSSYHPELIHKNNGIYEMKKESSALLMIFNDIDLEVDRQAENYNECPQYKSEDWYDIKHLERFCSITNKKYYAQIKSTYNTRKGNIERVTREFIFNHIEDIKDEEVKQFLKKNEDEHYYRIKQQHVNDVLPEVIKVLKENTREYEKKISSSCKGIINEKVNEYFKIDSTYLYSYKAVSEVLYESKANDEKSKIPELSFARYV